MNIERIKALFNLIQSTAFIMDNPEYLSICNNTKIELKSDDIVNAMAYSDKNNYHIRMHSGLINASYTAGYALASEDPNIIKHTMSILSNILHRKSNKKGIFTVVDGIECVKECIPDLTETQKLDGESYATGAILSVMAHELGHLCLHHTKTEPIIGGYSDPISRNNERCADLFSSSVSRSTPFSKYCIPSNVLMGIVLCWLSLDTVSELSTHPYSKERVDYLFNSNSDVLIQYGITETFIESLLR